MTADRPSWSWELVAIAVLCAVVVATACWIGGDAVPKIVDATARIEKAVERLETERKADTERLKIFEGARATETRQHAENLRISLRIQEALKKIEATSKGDRP